MIFLHSEPVLPRRLRTCWTTLEVSSCLARFEVPTAAMLSATVGPKASFVEANLYKHFGIQTFWYTKFWYTNIVVYNSSPTQAESKARNSCARDKFFFSTFQAGMGISGMGKSGLVFGS